jgi:hypothetical protein
MTASKSKSTVPYVRRRKDQLVDRLSVLGPGTDRNIILYSITAGPFPQSYAPGGITIVYAPSEGCYHDQICYCSADAIQNMLATAADTGVIELSVFSTVLYCTVLYCTGNG